MPVSVTNTATSLLLAVHQDVLQNPVGLLKVWGQRTLREIDDIFRAQGKPPWAPLASSTIAAKRQGKGSGGPQALAGLRAWSDPQIVGPRTVRVENTKPIALFHEYGTGLAGPRRAKYPIVPVNAKALALPFLPGRDEGKGTKGTGKPGRFSLSGLGRARNTGRGSYQKANGSTKVPYTNVSFRKKVMHPGVPARPMLPTPAQLTPLLEAETVNFVAFLARKNHG